MKVVEEKDYFVQFWKEKEAQMNNIRVCIFF